MEDYIRKGQSKRPRVLLGDVAMAAKRDGSLTLPQKHFSVGRSSRTGWAAGASPARKNLIPAASSATKLACYAPFPQ